MDPLGVDIDNINMYCTLPHLDRAVYHKSYELLRMQSGGIHSKSPG